MSIMDGFSGEIDNYVNAPRRSGIKWVPHFLVEFDHINCISCGRCIKVCPGGVYIFEDDGDKMHRLVFRAYLFTAGIAYTVIQIFYLDEHLISVVLEHIYSARTDFNAPAA